MRKIISDLEILRENLALANKTIIDVGCGTGDLARTLAEMGNKVYGIDIPEMIEKARKFPNSNKVEFQIGNGENLPFEDEFADIAIYIASFHHVPQNMMKQALSECHRVLKPGGKAFFIEPIAESGSYYEIIKLADDEKEIQELAYKFLSDIEISELRLLKDEKFFMERKFNDYVKLLTIFVANDEERNKMLEIAKMKTLELCQANGVDFDDFIYKSMARFMVFEKVN